MRKILYVFLLINLFCTTLFADGDRIFYKNVKLDVNLSKVKKDKLSLNHIYQEEDNARKYVKYLMSEKLLDIDNTKNYKISMIDKTNRWLVLLILTEKNENGVITQTFDYPTKYAFYINKNNGTVPDLYLIKQNHIPIK